MRARLAGWPAHAVVDPSALPSDERAFLERVAADTWRGLAALTDRENGLPVDHVRLAAPPTSGDGATDTTAGADVGDYTSISNVGLHLAAVVAAREIGLVGEADAVAAVTRVLDTLDRVETYQGLFFNYYDTTSLERSSNFLSFVDTSWLTTGLILARASFPALAARCSRLIERMHYGFFYDARRHQVSHGYYVHRRARSRYDYGVLYTEARLGVLLGIGTGEIPEDAWFDMVRTYPADCAGQTATPRGVRRRRVHGHTVVSGWYEWGGVRFVPSWGGSMFEALMPVLVVDEQRFAAQSLGANDVAHVLVQRRFATEELGYPVWGMSPSATPTGDGYGEYGVPVLGTRGYRPGAVTPHASALALIVDPEAAVALEVLIEGSLAALHVGLAKWSVDLWLKHRTADVDRAQGLVWRGRLHELTQDFPQALADFQQAVELAPDHAQARLRLAEALIREEPWKAAPHLEWLGRRRPGDPQVRFLTARLRRNLGQPEEAGQLLDAILAVTPDKVPVLVERGRVAMDLNQPQEAERWLQRALTLAPGQREVHLALGDCLRQAGRLDEAERHQDQALEIETKLKQKLEEMGRKKAGGSQ